MATGQRSGQKRAAQTVSEPKSRFSKRCISCVALHESLNRGTLSALRFSERPNGVMPNASWNDKSLSVMNYKWLKTTVGAFHDCFPALNQVQTIHAVVGVRPH